MEKGFTNIRSLLGAFARALNLINRDTQHHHEQTAYIAYRLAQQMGFTSQPFSFALSTM